jgi:hypothetical protein
VLTSTLASYATTASLAAYAPLASPSFTGSALITSSSATALAVGANGTTNPVLQINAATGSVATGIKITGAAAAGKVAIAVISSGTNEALTLDAKGTGHICVQYFATGNFGIGTNNPANKFVVSNQNQQGFEVSPTGGPGSGVAFQSYNRTTSAYIPNGFYASAHTFFSGTGSTRVMDISVAGGVSIGTMTDAGVKNLLVAGSVLSNGTAGIGYAAGAGSTVTQATSRTTGVTINTICGAITLASAAGTATWQTFTVTNSAVGANDVINVVQKSGANIYSIIVSQVAAGSFNLSVSAVSGTATESPVLNFSITKGVIA